MPASRIARTALTIAALAAVIAAAGGPILGQPVPLPANGSFEDVANGAPVGWRSATYQRTAEFAVDTVARTGARSVRISSTTGAEAHGRRLRRSATQSDSEYIAYSTTSNWKD